MLHTDPVAVEPWTGIYEAVNDVPECIQKHLYATEVTGNEDCLYLNVYTPQNTSRTIHRMKRHIMQKFHGLHYGVQKILAATPSKGWKEIPREEDILLPVMVFIHRGGWFSDSAKAASYGPNILLDKDIVLVVPNYRLGPFGFLSTQDDSLPGNMGLKDQLLALKWVQKNIAKFGGDPNCVTIFGRSAGAGSIHFHMMSPMSKGLFHRAIIQSGTALCPWAVPYREAKKNTIMLAESLGCPTNNSKNIVECLRKLDARNITDKNTVFMEWDTFPLNIYVPVIEHDHPNAFIKENPRKIIMEGKINPVSLIIGVCPGEGFPKAESIFKSPEVQNKFTKDFHNILPLTLGIAELNTKEIKEFYFDGNDVISNNSVQQVINLYNDALFGSCVIETVKLQMKYGTGEIYVYYFDYEGSNSASEQNNFPLKKYGINQVYDLFYLFPQKPLYTTENEMADTMTELWVNFAKSGKPTYHNKINWKPVVTDSVDYLHIKNNDDITMKNDLLKERANFWICLLKRKDNVIRYTNCL